MSLQDAHRAAAVPPLSAKMYSAVASLLKHSGSDGGGGGTWKLVQFESFRRSTSRIDGTCVRAAQCQDPMRKGLFAADLGL